MSEAVANGMSRALAGLLGDFLSQDPARCAGLSGACTVGAEEGLRGGLGKTQAGEGPLHAGEAGFNVGECGRISWEGDLHA